MLPTPPAPPSAGSSVFGPRAKLLFGAIVVVALVGVGLYLVSPDFRGSVENVVTPSCTVGLNGAAVSVTVQGLDAQAQCDHFLTQTTDGGTWYVYSGGQQPAGASICQVHYQGDQFTVRDSGALDLYGNSICSNLINAANGIVPGATATLAFAQPTQDPAVASAQAAAAASAATAAAAARARVNIDEAGAAAQSDIDGLTSSEADLSRDLAAIPSALSTMSGDVTATQRQRDVVLTEVSNGSTDTGTVCSDAASVTSDAATVQSDFATINSDGATLNGDYNTVQNGITDLQQHRNQLAAARNQLLSYADGGPSEAQIDAALATANSAIAGAQQTYAGYVNTAQGYVSTANGYATAAQQACDSRS